MTRATIFTAVLTATIALPAAASAHCSSIEGSFAVTCEQGVQVFRHQALSSFPRGLSKAETQLEIEKLRRETALENIAANERAQAVNAQLRDRELAIQDYQARVYDRNTRGRSYVSYGGGYGYGYGSGYQVAGPLGLNGNRANRGNGFSDRSNLGNRNTLGNRGNFGNRNTRGARRAGGQNTGTNAGTVQTTSSTRASGSRFVAPRRGGKKSAKKH